MLTGPARFGPDSLSTPFPSVLSRFIVCPVHVGRAREVEALRAVAATVAGGSGRTLLVSGEVGVGKTRMAAEAQRIAREAGFVTLGAGCVEGASTAYAPIATALRRHTRRLGVDGARALFGGPARLVAALLPEIAGDLGVEGLAPGLAAEDLHAAMWHLLARAGDGRPVLLLVEDLHWASEDMLRLCAALIRETRELPVLIVGTYRPDEITRHHPLSETLVGLSRDRCFEEMRLEPLDRDGVTAMLGAIFDGEPIGDEFVEAVWRRSSGSPFFVEEICRVLVDRGDVFREGAGWGRRELEEIELPATVREAILARTRRLPADVVAALQLAAVAGELVEPDVLRIAASLDVDGVRRVLSAAIDAQLLVEQREERRRQYRFRHNLTREFLAAERVGPERQDAHGRVARALEEVYADDLDAVAAAVADHHEEAGELRRAADMAARAARHAVAERAPHEAVDRYVQALRLLGRDDPAARLALLVEAAEGTVDARDRRAAMAFATEAERLAGERDDCVAEVRALRVEAQARWWDGDVDRALELAGRLAALVDGRGDRWELAVISYVARRHALLDHEDVAAELVERGLRLAAQLDEPVEESRLWETRAVLGRGDVEEAIERALAAARRAGDLGQEVAVLGNGASIEVWHGALGRARQRLEAALALCERLVTPREAFSRAAYAEVLAIMGRLGEAETMAGAVERETEVPVRQVALSALAEVAFRRGDEAALGARAAELWQACEGSESQTLLPALAARARARLADGPDAAAPVWAEALERAGTARGARLLLWTFVPDWARALHASGDSAGLQRLAAETARLVGDGAAHAHNVAAMRLVEGLAALAAARAGTEGGGGGELLDAARTALEGAADGYAALASTAREVEARIALAELESAAGVGAASAAAAQAALATATAHAMTPLVDEAAAALRRTGVRVTARRAASRGADELSPRERAVAALVSRGCTNAEIGRRLFLSELTARNYVSSILGKLDLRSRAEVARWAAANGLVEEPLASPPSAAR